MRAVLPGHPVYREGVFVLLPGCWHWLRTCSAFLKLCHPCYGMDSTVFPIVSSPSNLDLFFVAATTMKRIVANPPLSILDRKKFLTPVISQDIPYKIRVSVQVQHMLYKMFLQFLAAFT